MDIRAVCESPDVAGPRPTRRRPGGHPWDDRSSAHSGAVVGLEGGRQTRGDTGETDHEQRRQHGLPCLLPGRVQSLDHRHVGQRRTGIATCDLDRDIDRVLGLLIDRRRPDERRHRPLNAAAISGDSSWKIWNTDVVMTMLRYVYCL